jgi:hypothetical protein
MNKIVSIEKPKNQLAASTGRPNPPPARIVPMADFDGMQKDVTRYGSICKDLDQTERDITTAIKYLSRFNPEGHLADLLKRGDLLLARYEQQAPSRERLVKQIEAFNPEDDPECDGGGIPNRRHVAKQVGLLLGAFPSGSPADPAVYTSMMIEEVLGANRTKFALESAVRTARRTLKFLPTISEVLAILKAEEKGWDERLNDFYCEIEVESLKKAITNAHAKIEEIENEYEAQAKNRSQLEIAKHTFEAGKDRVKHTSFGDGSVISVDGNKCIVKFDNKDAPVSVISSFLEHLTVCPFDSEDPKNAF